MAGLTEAELIALYERGAHKKAAEERERNRVLTKGEVAARLSACRSCEHMKDDDGLRVVCDAPCRTCRRREDGTVHRAITLARETCPVQRWNGEELTTETQRAQSPDGADLRETPRSPRLRGGAQSPIANRKSAILLVLRHPGYRAAQTDRMIEALRAAQWRVEVRESPLHPDRAWLKETLARMDKPAAVIRWEEQGGLFGRGRNWRAIAAWCYEEGIAPVSVDYGYFDHYSTMMFDRYRPDGTSAVIDDWPALTGASVDWVKEADARTAAYVERVQKLYAQARAMPPLAEPGYVAVFLQFSAGLSRLRAKGNVKGWAQRVYGMLTDAGLRVVFKGGPVGRSKQRPDCDAPYFAAKRAGGDANILLNARIAVHARNVVMITSSVSSEFVVAGIPVLATGRSWFHQVRSVFDNAENWDAIARMPVVDHGARSKYIRWWLAHQWYPEQATDRLADRIADFNRCCNGAGIRTIPEHGRTRTNTDSAGTRTPDSESVSVRVSPCSPIASRKSQIENQKAVLANDTGHARHMGCQATTRGLERLLAEKNIEIIDRIPVGALDRSTPVDRLAAGDLLVVNGEGSIHHGNVRARGIMAAIRAAKQADVETWIVNHESHKNDRLLGGYRHADYVATRDDESCQYLKRHGIPAHNASDCTFLLDPAPSATAQAAEKTGIRAAGAALQDVQDRDAKAGRGENPVPVLQPPAFSLSSCAQAFARLTRNSSSGLRRCSGLRSSASTASIPSSPAASVAPPSRRRSRSSRARSSSFRRVSTAACLPRSTACRSARRPRSRPRPRRWRLRPWGRTPNASRTRSTSAPTWTRSGTKWRAGWMDCGCVRD